MEAKAAKQKARWRVSARHQIPPHASVGPQPFGTYHARWVGASSTLCGEPALNWKFFWELTFEPFAPGACIECSQEVTAQLGDQGPERPKRR